MPVTCTDILIISICAVCIAIYDYTTCGTIPLTRLHRLFFDYLSEKDFHFIIWTLNLMPLSPHPPKVSHFTRPPYTSDNDLSGPMRKLSKFQDQTLSGVKKTVELPSRCSDFQQYKLQAVGYQLSWQETAHQHCHHCDCW